jgi:hypothetical protein
MSVRSHGCVGGFERDCTERAVLHPIEHAWEIRYSAAQWDLAANCTLAIKQSDDDFPECDYVEVDSCRVDGLVDTKCEVKRKGTSTWRDLGSKPSFKIKLDDKHDMGSFDCSSERCPPGQTVNRWHTKKFTLNNQVIHDGDIDAYAVYRSLTPASLAVQVTVALFREGVLQSNTTYAMVENVNDKEFANKWFGDDWRLYETEHRITKFERAGGVFKDGPTDWDDAPKPVTTELALADVDQSNMVRYYVGTTRINDFDGACGPNVNNHYLLHDGTAWHHIPWGQDQTFVCHPAKEQTHLPPIVYESCGAMNECMRTDACRREYDAVVREMAAHDTFRKVNCYDTALAVVLLNVLLPPAVAACVVLLFWLQLCRVD